MPNETRRQGEAFDALRSCAVFANFTDSDLEGLAAQARREEYSGRTLLVANRSAPDRLRLVIRGRVELSLNSEDGRAATLPIGPGKWATWLGCMLPDPIEHEMWCAPGSAFLSWPAGAVRRLIENDNAALRMVIRQIGATTRLLIGWSLASTLFAPDKRVAYALLAIAGDGERAGEAVRLTQEQIGQMGLGTRQRVSRVLHALQEKGLVEIGYGVVTLPSPKRLAAYVFGKPVGGELPPHPGIRLEPARDVGGGI